MTMARLTFNRVILECDGCQKRHGEPAGHNSPTEARLAGYVDGWRFPSNLRSNGQLGDTESDVCPECMPSWVPRTRRAAGRRLRTHEAPTPEQPTT
ncbi:hypothetical protein ACFYPA_06355 [Streptomyces sp. NPDC005775]|uniref:hypothetical protein n=1 Tax=Streptomyces sp. NPDC005775 TaxID=3364729 RepID=UPI00369314C9